MSRRPWTALLLATFLSAQLWIHFNQHIRPAWAPAAGSAWQSLAAGRYVPTGPAWAGQGLLWPQDAGGEPLWLSPAAEDLNVQPLSVTRLRTLVGGLGVGRLAGGGRPLPLALWRGRPLVTYAGSDFALAPVPALGQVLWFAAHQTPRLAAGPRGAVLGSWQVAADQPVAWVWTKSKGVTLWRLSPYGADAVLHLAAGRPVALEGADAQGNAYASYGPKLFEIPPHRLAVALGQVPAGSVLGYSPASRLVLACDHGVLQLGELGRALQEVLLPIDLYCDSGSGAASGPNGFALTVRKLGARARRLLLIGSRGSAVRIALPLQAERPATQPFWLNARDLMVSLRLPGRRWSTFVYHLEQPTAQSRVGV